MQSSRGLWLGLAWLATVACADDEPARGGGGAGTGGGGAGTGATAATGASGPGAGAGPQGGAGTGGAGGAAQGGGGAGQGGGGAPPLTVAQCYADDFVTPPSGGPDYDQFGVVVGSHCMGTNHQDITGVQRVVFVGDSVTVGTPPTLSGDYYRNRLAEMLASKFNLSVPGFFWQTVDVLNGVSLDPTDGDFANCAKWGARTDDLILDNTQLADCVPPGEEGKTTLFVMTMGGNDIAALTQDAIDGVPMNELWARTQAFVQNMRDAVDWIETPGRFPNGAYVIFANMYEFTDGTGNVQACDVSGLAGFDQPVPSPDELKAMVIWANEEYAHIAADYQVDMIFMLEDFCGHGFEHDNPQAPCYRGPNTPVWFDLTCIHPNPDGHAHLADMFMAVVDE